MKEPKRYEPTPQAPAIEAFLTSVLGASRRSYIGNNRCVFCSDPDMKFRDALSEKEYTITGLCQKCQDKQFKPKDNE